MVKKSRMPLIVILTLLAAVLIFALVIIIRTTTYKFVDQTPKAVAGNIDIKVSEESLRRFSGGIRIPTVSNQVLEQTDFGPFDRFKEYLEEQYPEIYSVMETGTVNTYGLTFRWKGKDSSKLPILFLSHYDVVPVNGYEPEPGYEPEVVFRPDDNPLPDITELDENWIYDPFSGAVADGRIYGRGTLDMKNMLFAIMEAADELVKSGFEPERDIWFAFGQDEEVGGLEGAVKIAEHFRQQGLRFDAVYDEGGIISAPGTAGINRPLGVVGTGEKGFLTLRITVRGIGGHSSMPPKKSSLVLAAEIITKLNEDQMPLTLIEPIEKFLDNTGSEMNFTSRMAIANQWLLRPVLLKTLSKEPASNALVRTTTAITMARASEAANVISSTTDVTVNFRILPGQTVKDVMDHVERLCDGYDVGYEIVNSREPSAISPTDVRGFEIIREVASDIYPDAIITPYITIGGTDAYKYQSVSDNIYRFMPVYLNNEQQRSIHNENEHISIENFGRMIYYFRRLMQEF